VVRGGRGRVGARGVDHSGPRILAWPENAPVNRGLRVRSIKATPGPSRARSAG